MQVIGLDIGGANLKASDGEHRSVTHSFAIWRSPERLPEELHRLLSAYARPRELAVTMTAELADCFETKAEGVDRILTAVESAVDVPVHVWQRGGEFVSPAEARELPMLVAAANWHALATWAGRMVPKGVGLLIDVGSTTTDIIPLIDGLPAVEGGTDIERLASGALVYTGVRRTPVCAVTKSVSLRGRDVPLAAEFFASMYDVFLIMGQAAEDESQLDTADGRPATPEFARSRLARMLCCDRNELTDDDLLLVAKQVAKAQHRQLLDALTQVLERLPEVPSAVLLAGEGQDVTRRIVEASSQFADCEKTYFHRVLGSEHSIAACAFALARLGGERLR